MAWIIEDVCACVTSDCVQEPRECSTVVQILPRVNFIAEIDARLVEPIENRQPAPAEFGKRFLDKASRALRPRIQETPDKSAGKGGMGR